MTKIIIYAVAALVIVTAILWAVNSVINIGVELQAAKDAPIIAGLTKQRDQAIAANKSLTADLAGLKATVDSQNGAIASWEADARAASAAAAAAIAKARASSQSAKDAAETARLTQIATTVPVNQTAEADCAEAHSILADLARARRLRQQSP